LRKLCIYLTELPEDSRLIRELRIRQLELTDEDDQPWTRQEGFLAAIINELREGNYLFQLWLYGNSSEEDRRSGKAAKPQPPEYLMPPGYQPPKEEYTYATKEDFMAFMDQIR
jgi:hypothetical protein